MLADLAAVVEDLDVPFDGESLEQAIALRDRLDARIAQAAGTFEANGWWAGDASASFVAWLRAHAKMTRRSALRLRTLAVRLRALPMCAQAYAEGWLSGGQIEAMSPGSTTGRRSTGPPSPGCSATAPCTGW